MKTRRSSKAQADLLSLRGRNQAAMLLRRQGVGHSFAAIICYDLERKPVHTSTGLSKECALAMPLLEFKKFIHEAGQLKYLGKGRTGSRVNAGVAGADGTELTIGSCICSKGIDQVLPQMRALAKADPRYFSSSRPLI